MVVLLVWICTGLSSKFVRRHLRLSSYRTLFGCANGLGKRGNCCREEKSFNELLTRCAFLDRHMDVSAHQIFRESVC